MRTSADYFDQPYAFENLDESPGIRPTVPLVAEKIAAKKSALPPLPKVKYPIYTPPPPPQNTALEQIQQAIQKEVSDYQQKKPNLDQLIQNAMKQKLQHEQQIAQQAMVIKKSAPTPVIQKVTHKMVPTEPVKVMTKAKPKVFQQPTRQLWWPSEQEIVTEKIKKPAVKVIDTPKISSALKPVPLQNIKTPIQKSPLPKVQSNSNQSIQQALAVPATVAKTAFHVSTNFLSYFLFAISNDEDPYNDPTRQKIIYGLKAGAYLMVLVAIFEFIRNTNIGMSLNGTFEIISIFLIAAILFFFGENLNILFKPINPYQIREVV